MVYPPGTYPPHRECDNHPRNRFHPRLLRRKEKKITYKDMDEKALERQIREIVENAKQTDPASEELAQCLNAIIGEWQLQANEVLSILARVTAGFIQRMKQEYHTPEQKDDVEEYFSTALHTYIACSDMNNMYKVIAEMRRKNAN